MRELTSHQRTNEQATVLTAPNFTIYLSPERSFLGEGPAAWLVWFYF
jgi:hypothetical protein